MLTPRFAILGACLFLSCAGFVPPAAAQRTSSQSATAQPADQPAAKAPDNPEMAPAEVRFNRDIRPLLSDRCFACHGPDEKRREADLRLDDRASAIAGRGSRAAIVPGHPDQSLILERITSADPDLVMPPPSTKKPAFTAEEIDRLRRWIANGATYQGHWALLPIQEPRLPEFQRLDRQQNSIDSFVAAQLDAQRIEPSPAADRATLIRRLSLDLTGLPPTPDEAAAFIQDGSPQAYEMLVDRLLQSPHFGERWGRHWLDQARYADSNGYSIDGDRDMWPYRDWVINALNDDLPFDQFTIEQLAGDLLPSPTKSQLIASAFHRNTLINQEGGTDREQFRVEATVDRVNTTGAVWLGLTIGCAQCHSHKYDPLAQREFYELFAFFNSAEDANDRGPTVAVARGEAFGTPNAMPPAAKNAGPDVAKLQREWEDAERQRLAKRKANSAAPAKWTAIDLQSITTASAAPLTRLPDNSILADARVAAKDEYVVRFRTELARVAGLRLRVLTHDSLPKKGPGLAGNGNFVLTQVTLSVDGRAVVWKDAVADHEQPKYGIRGTLDADPNTGWAINVAPGSTAVMNADHEALFTLAESAETAGKTCEIRLRHEANDNYQLGRFLIELSDAPPSSWRAEDESLLAALERDAAARSPEQQKLVRAAFELAVPAARPKPPAANPNIAQLMIMRDRPQPRETYLLTRGDFTRPDKSLGALAPNVPLAIPPALPTSEPQSTSRNRLDLARWLTDPANPLPARVTVNRVWMRLFGRGLVETEEDFGTQGTPPTHPELLDWLAADFQRSGWSVKRLVRQIVTSATYRQSSVARPDLLARDPRNVYLARQERLRAEAEVIRDAALAASGLLDRTIGGPSVRPPQPDGVYAFTQTVKSWNAATGGQRFRRGLYTLFYRSAPYPLFTTFDAPDFQTVCTRRIRSNTPLQSLTLANDPAFLEIARGLAARAVREVPGEADATRDARVRHAFQVALTREPSPIELQILTQFAAAQQTAFATDAAAAVPFVGGEAALRELRPEAAAALVAVSRAILNCDNFITRE